MSHLRPTPFELLFQQTSQDVFPRIRSRLAEGGHDPGDRDRFLMLREVVTLLRELRPDEGLGEGIDQLAALLHHAYLYWAAGQLTVELARDRMSALLSAPAAEGAVESLGAYYFQVPERRLWAEVIPGQPPEPLDGCFIHPSTDGATLRVLGVFGVYPEREGFSVVEASGPRQNGLVRLDGSPLFSPVLPGGAAAGLFSIAGEEELVELGWRVQLGAGSHQLPAPSSQLLAPSS